ncbi:MAG: hypothetical protein QOG70_2760 [Solirubrobacteraceae bacterium]|nr:hypothetical protein [Solirubrobacteraceae bacterium]
MTIERVFHCDGPECERRGHTTRLRHEMFLVVSERGGSALHFCGWDCVLRYAATKEPEQIVAGPGSFDVDD